MAHHTKTPASVLNAPTRTVLVSATPLGATRHERRHGVYIGGMTEKDGARFMRQLRRYRNAPAVLALPRRGKKVRRGGLR